jgi:hypothetical protein
LEGIYLRLGIKTLRLFFRRLFGPCRETSYLVGSMGGYDD